MKLAGKSPIGVIEDLCVRVRFSKAQCRDCIDECPLSAIKVDKGIKIDEICDGCSRCISACSQGVFYRVGEITRRDFLNLLFPHSTTIKNRRGLNRVRKKLIESLLPEDLELENNPLFSGLKITDLSVSNKCIGCNVCEYVCPGGAIRREEGRDTFRLFFDGRWCTDCGNCSSACLTGAISFNRTDLKKVFFNKERLLIELRKTRCKMCDNEYYGNGMNLCPRCDNRFIKNEMEVLNAF